MFLQNHACFVKHINIDNKGGLTNVKAVEKSSTMNYFKIDSV